MSWHTACLFIHDRFGRGSLEFLSRLGIPGSVVRGQVGFDQATSSSVGGRAYAYISGWHVVFDPTMFFDLIASPRLEDAGVWPAVLEARFIVEKFDVVGLLLEGSSGTFGYTEYKTGRRTRCLLVQGDNTILDEGPASADELAAFVRFGDAEQALLHLAFESTVGLASLRSSFFDVIQ